MKIRLIIGILLVVGGVASFIKALDVRKDVNVSAEWPYVEGKIVKSELSPSTFARTQTGPAYNP